MGLWDFLKELFGVGGSNGGSGGRDARHQEDRRRSSNESARQSARTQSIVAARVEYVGPKFAKLSWGGHRGIVFIGEITQERIAAVSDALSIGDEVEAAIIGPNDRKPGEYVLSLLLVDEIRQREALAALKAGDRIKVQVVRVEADRVFVQHDQAHGSIERTELLHEIPETCVGRVLRGQHLDVEVVSITLPTGWERDRRQRGRAQFVASARRALPLPPSTLVAVAYTALPFAIEVKPRLPPEFDPVARFVFERVAAGDDVRQICQVTALPSTVVERVLAFVEQLGFLHNGQPTARGIELRQALERIDEFNRSPIERLFVSAAPPDAKFRAIDEMIDWPADRPLPVRDSKIEEQFLRATSDEISDLPFRDAMTGDLRGRIREAADDRFLRVFVRPRRGRAPFVVRVQVDSSWLLVTLWRNLDSAERTSPPRFGDEIQGARHVRLLECSIHLLREDARRQRTAYWEPETDTLWASRAQPPRLLKLPDCPVPALPSDVHTRIATRAGTEIEATKPQRWVTLEDRGAGRG